MWLIHHIIYPYFCCHDSYILKSKWEWILKIKSGEKLRSDSTRCAQIEGGFHSKHTLHTISFRELRWLKTDVLNTLHCCCAVQEIVQMNSIHKSTSLHPSLCFLCVIPSFVTLQVWWYMSSVFQGWVHRCFVEDFAFHNKGLIFSAAQFSVSF